MKKILGLILSISLFFACTPEPDNDANIQIFRGFAEGNIYTDTSIQNIEIQFNTNVYLSKISANGQEILPEYRKHILHIAASAQDTTLCPLISDFLDDTDDEVRLYAAFAMGQNGGLFAEKKLLESLEHERMPNVTEQILTALGKCGSEKSFQKVLEIKLENQYPAVISGIAQALEKFAERNIKSEASISKLVQIVSDATVADTLKYAAAYALTRCKSDLSRHIEELIEAFNTTEYIYTRSALVKALQYTKSIQLQGFIEKIIENSKLDYRTRLNAVSVARSLPYSELSPKIFSLLDAQQAPLAIAASEFFTTNGSVSDLGKYLDYARKISNPFVKANLLAAALKYSESKTSVSELIKKSIENEQNKYAKAAYIKALSSDISQYRYVMHKTFFERDYVIASAGIETLAQMRASENFATYAKNHAGKKENVEEAFAEIFQKAILSGDVALMAISAQTLRDERFNYGQIYKNTYFIKQGLKKCVLPRDYEAYIELLKTDTFLNGTEYHAELTENHYTVSPKPEQVQAIPIAQKIRFITTKGTFLIQLDVNTAPATVDNFIRLVWDNYFDNKAFHRIVPDFVAQTGCARGDGWGAESYCIRSEFSMKPFVEGSVGMASSGKDTESTQWFINLSPAPHLNGRYTNFGFVTEGMEVVHKLELGDRIIDAELLL